MVADLGREILRVYCLIVGLLWQSLDTVFANFSPFHISYIIYLIFLFLSFVLCCFYIVKLLSLLIIDWLIHLTALDLTWFWFYFDFDLVRVTSTLTLTLTWLWQRFYFKYLNFANPHIKSLGLDPQECSFNSGVFVFNVDQWRLNNVTDALVHWMSLNTRSL